ncbi:MAG: hypothetical protein ABIE74_02765 [Pseudomonadota bacterium]
MSILAKTLFNKGPVGFRTQLAFPTHSLNDLALGTTALCLIQYGLKKNGQDDRALEGRLSGIMQLCAFPRIDQSSIVEGMKNAADQLLQIKQRDSDFYNQISRWAENVMTPLLTERGSEGTPQISAIAEIENCIGELGPSALAFIGSRIFNSATAASPVAIADIPNAHALPDGQIIAMDTMVKQRSDLERIQVAVEKIREKLQSIDKKIVDEIEKRFFDELYLQNLSPQIWRDRAQKIVKEVLGDCYRGFENKINQVLFVSSRFHFAEIDHPEILKHYDEGEALPMTIIDTPLRPSDHTMHDINGYLNNRLGSTIIGLLQHPDCDIEIFIGPKEDMLAYYRSKEPSLTLKGEVDSPTSTEFYLFKNGTASSTVVISGINNPSRFRHQLWQLKYAGIDVRCIRTRGTFEQALKPQIETLHRELAKLPVKPRIVIVGQRWWPMEILGKLAGIEGDEGIAYETLKPTQYQIGPFTFDYLIAEVTGANAGRSSVGVIALRMPNGSLAGEAVRALLDNGATHLLLAGAGGSLSSESPVGSYQIFRKSSYDGKQHALPESAVFVPMLGSDFPLFEIGDNVTVDSPLEESRRWFGKSCDVGNSVVDVESAHIFQAIVEAVRDNPDISVTPGLFVSDVVGGEESLVEKISGENAYSHLKSLLNSWFLQLGISGVYDVSGKLHRFDVTHPVRNSVLIRNAQSVSDTTRREIMGLRMSTDDFKVVSQQRKRVDYNDFQSMMGHKHILYVVPPSKDSESAMESFKEFLKKSDPEKLFLTIPSNTPQTMIEMMRKYGYETIIIVEPDNADLPAVDYIVSRGSGWGTYNTVAATNSHAIVVFGDPSANGSLLSKMENQNRPIYVYSELNNSPVFDGVDEFETFDNDTLIEKLNKSLKLNRLEKWVTRVRQDIKLVKLSEVRAYAEGRMIIGVSGSSKISQFNPELTENVFRDLLKRSDPRKVMFATGGTDYGVEQILHRLIREKFPEFKLIGFITNEGKGDDLGTPAVTCAGNDWFGKSVPFLNAIDLFITVSGGGVIEQELLMAHKAGIPTFPLAGSGMGTDKFLKNHPEMARHYTGEEIAEGIKPHLY